MVLPLTLMMIPSSALREKELPPHDLDPVRIEGEEGGDFADVRLRRLVGPDRIVVAVIAGDNRKIVGLALVGTGGDAVGALEKIHVDVFARDIGDELIARFGELERTPGVADRMSAPDDAHALRDGL